MATPLSSFSDASWSSFTMSNLFKLKHEKVYSVRPDLRRYFMPVIDTEFQERLEKRKGDIATMMKSTEFNQDKTSLIVTNNPLPLLFSGQRVMTPFYFFSNDLLGKSVKKRLPPVKEPQGQLVSPDFRKPGKPLPFRFATAKDFKSEGKFSKVYTERRLLRLYPQLRTHWFPKLESPKTESHPRIEGPAPRMKDHWEPLSLVCLEETKPIRVAPGDDGFRYGQAPLWILNKSVVPNPGK